MITLPPGHKPMIESLVDPEEIINDHLGPRGYTIMAEHFVSFHNPSSNTDSLFKNNLDRIGNAYRDLRERLGVFIHSVENGTIRWGIATKSKLQELVERDYPLDNYKDCMPGRYEYETMKITHSVEDLFICE